MIKKPVALVAILALIVVMSGSAASGRTNPAVEGETAKPAAEKTGRKGDARLKSDMNKLVADAKAGKISPKPQHFPDPTRHNLSKGATIAIAAGVGVAIFLIIMFRALNSDDD